MLEELEKLIDEFINKLKQQLVQPWTAPVRQRGISDRIKGWWANLTQGRYNQNNPYFWKNKLGDDLGATVPLEHYRFIQDQSIILESSLPEGTPNLQVLKIVDSWGAQFKAGLMNLFRDKFGIKNGEELKNHIDNSKKPPLPRLPEETPEEPEKPDDAYMKNQPPSVKGRSWSQLDSHEQFAWDEWGGGATRDITIISKKNGINTMPWIVRIGDPRLKELQHLRIDSLLEKLIRQKRIENPSHPIKNQSELNDAVSFAKEIDKKEREEQKVKDDLKPKLPPKKSKEPENPNAPVVKAMDLPPIQDDLKDKADELKSDLDKMKDNIPARKFNKLTTQLDSDNEDKIDQAGEEVKRLKEKWGEEGSGGSFKMEMTKAEQIIHDFKIKARS